MTSSNIWEDIHFHKSWGKYPNEEVIRFVGKNFFRLPTEERKKIKILDLGLGQGSNSLSLIKEGFDVYGIDIAPSGISKFKKRLEEENVIVEDFDDKFKVGDIREIPFLNSVFDVVIDCATTWYVSHTEHKLVYKEINRVLVDDGLFFSWHILKNSWGYSEDSLIDKNTLKMVEEGPLANQGISYFADYDDLIELLNNNDFKIEEKEKLTKSYENMTKTLKYAIIHAKKIR
ncbi:hypothetical protein BVX95_00705 [archaeon D22]|nr:hypothetical protein BVX95_00705 [archaeon D22]